MSVSFPNDKDWTEESNFWPFFLLFCLCQYSTFLTNQTEIII